MLNTCKFCPLTNAADHEITYELIVEAIMQLALNLTTKHKSGRYISCSFVIIILIFNLATIELTIIMSIIRHNKMYQDKVKQCFPLFSWLIIDFRVYSGISIFDTI